MTPDAPRADAAEGVAALRGAVARGWCAQENAHKVMDPDLAEAIVREVLAHYALRDAVVAAAVAWQLDPQRRALGRTLERAVDAYEAASGGRG